MSGPVFRDFRMVAAENKCGLAIAPSLARFVWIGFASSTKGAPSSATCKIRLKDKKICKSYSTGFEYF